MVASVAAALLAVAVAPAVVRVHDVRSNRGRTQAVWARHEAATTTTE
jgi:dihydropteroate synthase